MRSARCSTRCALQLTLPASWDIAIIVAFVVGLLLYGIGTSMLRSSREPAPVSAPVRTPARTRVAWPRLVDDSLTDTDPELRLDLVERLSIIGEPWCVEILRHAGETEDDPDVKSAISVALSQLRPSAP